MDINDARIIEAIFDDKLQPIMQRLDEHTVILNQHTEHNQNVDKRLDKMITDILELDSRMVKIESKVNGIESKVNTIEKQINTLGEEVTALKRTVSFLNETSERMNRRMQSNENETATLNAKFNQVSLSAKRKPYKMKYFYAGYSEANSISEPDVSEY